MRFLYQFPFLLFFFLFGCKKDNVVDLKNPRVKVQTIISNQEVIWGLDFFPNETMIYTEKQGNLFLFSNQKIIKINTNKLLVNSKGQGGMLDVRIPPNFNDDNWVYLTFSNSDKNGFGLLNLCRFKVLNAEISEYQILFTTKTSDSSFSHYGGRIEFDDSGHVYLSIGEGGNSSYGGLLSDNLNAQNPLSDWGKIHRFNLDGSIPKDNPTVYPNTKPTSLFSLGHRNPQGLAFNLKTKELWSSEHGPMGGDEINIIQPGKNYGWPFLSFGINYDGTIIPVPSSSNSFEKPIKYWVPSIAPCGIIFINHPSFLRWDGDLLVCSLKFEFLGRYKFDNSDNVEEEKLYEKIGRVRSVRQKNDGSIYFSVENPGRILKISIDN